MRPLTRRSVATGLAVAVAAPAFAGFGDGRDDAALLAAIAHYRKAISVEAVRGLSDEELDAAIDGAQRPLLNLVGVPVVTAAGALAALDLLIEEHLLEIGCEAEDASDYVGIMASMAKPSGVISPQWRSNARLTRRCERGRLAPALFHWAQPLEQPALHLFRSAATGCF